MRRSFLNHRGPNYKLNFAVAEFSIYDGLKVGAVRRMASHKLGVSTERIKLLYKGQVLRDDESSRKAMELKHRSELMCVVVPDATSLTGSSNILRSENTKKAARKPTK